VETEGALFNHPMGPGREWPGAPNAVVRRSILTMIFFGLLLIEIEASYPIGTGGHTILTADTLSEVLHNDSVFPAVGCDSWANGHAWGIFAVHTGHRDEFGFDARICAVGCCNHLVPEYLPSRVLLFRRSMRDIVFFLASDRARLAASAFI